MFIQKGYLKTYFLPTLHKHCWLLFRVWNSWRLWIKHMLCWQATENNTRGQWYIISHVLPSNLIMPMYEQSILTSLTFQVKKAYFSNTFILKCSRLNVWFNLKIVSLLLLNKNPIFKRYRRQYAVKHESHIHQKPPLLKLRDLIPSTNFSMSSFPIIR